MPFWKINKFLNLYEEELREQEEAQKELEQERQEPDINIIETDLSSESII